MCLILLAWRAHARQPLVVAANRDEFHARHANRAGFWTDKPEILAGRDLQAGGTWMGVSRNGRFAAVTNYRGGRDANAAESRGALVTRFLAGNASPADYVAGMAGKLGAYSGFNLLACDGSELWWLTNRDGGARRLAPGYYGLGNFLLDTPEVDESKARFARALDPAVAMEPLFGVLNGARILAPDYGTRCSTVLIADPCGGTRYAERAFNASGEAGETVRYELRPRV
ncbi:MAG: NRDE family protein [Betaproteobacteria bacterium]